MHGVFGVRIVLAEDQRLGHEGAAGEQIGEQHLLEGLQHGADLRLDHHRAVEVTGLVGEVFVEPFPAHGAGFLAAPVDVETLLHFAALLGDFGANAKDLIADIDAIGDGALVVVFHHEVLVEEADGLLRRRGGEADQVGVEILEHLPPEAVDGAVAFVGDDEVEGFDGDARVVGHVLWAVVRRGDLVAGFFVEVFVEFLAAQDGVQALDGADGDAGDRIEIAEARCWTLYASVNLRPVSGATNCCNSATAWRPRLARSTTNSTRFAPAYLMSR